jgi:mono/diheme cytochrome c family protein
MRPQPFRKTMPTPRHFGRVLLFCAMVAPSATLSADRISSAAPFVSKGRALDEQGGAALFASVCAACHQSDGKGAVGAASYPSLAGNPSVASADYLTNLLFSGLRAMPPVGRMMSDQQAADVINYVRSHFDNDYSDTMSPAGVQKIRTEIESGR